PVHFEVRDRLSRIGSRGVYRHSLARLLQGTARAESGCTGGLDCGGHGQLLFSRCTLEHPRAGGIESREKSATGCFGMTNRDWVDRFLQYLRIEKGVAENTIQSYRHGLEM